MADLEIQEWVLYLRKSKGRAGIARQRRSCQAHIERIGGRIVAEFIDTDRTAFVKVGAGPARRDNYAAMLDELRFDTRLLPLGVLAWHADRLDRDPGSAETFIAECAKGHHPVETARSGSYDLSTPTGRKRFRNDVVDAAYEVDHAIERIEAMKLESASEGRWLGGRRPFGFESDGVTVRPSEAAELASKGDELLAGVSINSIVRDWNARGVTTTTGRPWTGNSVRRVFLRPRNAGLMEHRSEIVGKAEWPAVIEETKWRAIVALLNDPSRRTSPGPQRKWMGSGIYECGVCVEAGVENSTVLAATAGMGTGEGRKTVPSYRCRSARNHIARNPVHLDRYVSMLAIEWLSRPGAVQAFEAVDDDGAARARVLEREALRIREEEAAEMQATGEMTKAQFIKSRAITAERRAELDRADAAAARLTALRPFRKGNAAAVWEGLDLDRRRAVVLELMQVIILPAKLGRPDGWTPEYGKEWGYFNPEAIRIIWRA